MEIPDEVRQELLAKYGFTSDDITRALASSSVASGDGGGAGLAPGGEVSTYSVETPFFNFMKKVSQEFRVRY